MAHAHHRPEADQHHEIRHVAALPEGSKVSAQRSKLTDRIRVSRAHDMDNKCPNCNATLAQQPAIACWECGYDLVLGAARSDADSVRVQRVGRLLARWRRTSETLWKHAEMWSSDNDRAAAAQLDGLIDELDAELEVAGEWPTAELRHGGPKDKL